MLKEFENIILLFFFEPPSDKQTGKHFLEQLFIF
jgi:hypothetical protein